MKNWISLIISLMGLCGSNGTLAEPEAAHEPLSAADLQKRIEQILERTHTPGAAVAVVGSDGVIWQSQLGLADVATNSPVTADTVFRIGSVSKMFVALAVMKLVEEGKLMLNSRLATLAPEIKFKNPWEQTNPVRLIHLLEHTTGWDAPHFTENAQNQKSPIAPRTALAFHPHSRVSRWVPGSRSAYNNTGPLVAAYLVEKVTGHSYEDYVKQNLLVPISMLNTDYFYTDHYMNNAATLYRNGVAQPYWHLNNRAAGGANSTLSDMINFARFLINGGRFDGRRIVSASSLVETESPYSSLAARAGLEVGFGLGNSIFQYNGYLYHGHQGELPGTQALVVYQKDLAVAHVILINSNGPALAEIHELLSEFETRGQQRPVAKTSRSANKDQKALSGIYRSISPLSRSTSFLQYLTATRLVIGNSEAFIKPLVGGKKRRLLPGLGTSMLQNATNAVVLVPGDDPLAGKVLYYGPQTLKKISAFSTFGALAIFGLWVISAFTALLYSLVWLPRRGLKKIDPGPPVQVRLWPLISVLSVILFIVVLILINTSTVSFELLGTVNAYSLTLTFSSLAFATSTGWSLYVLIQNRNLRMNRVAYWHSALLGLLNVVVVVYLVSFSMIGIRTWL